MYVLVYSSIPVEEGFFLLKEDFRFESGHCGSGSWGQEIGNVAESFRVCRRTTLNRHLKPSAGPAQEQWPASRFMERQSMHGAQISSRPSSSEPEAAE
jgi:hypothetical protein